MKIARKVKNINSMRNKIRKLKRKEKRSKNNLDCKEWRLNLNHRVGQQEAIEILQSKLLIIIAKLKMISIFKVSSQVSL